MLQNVCQSVLKLAIELIWAQVKRYVAVNNTTFKIKDCETCERRYQPGYSREMAKVCNHVQNVELEMCTLDGIRDAHDEVVINLSDSSEDETNPCMCDTEASSLTSGSKTEDFDCS